ncbi:MAG TPA: hypothetical protein VGB37_14750 [Candidatus Lokiarchaeia archaeon]
MKDKKQLIQEKEEIEKQLEEIEKQEKMKTCKITPCHNGKFHNIDCLEDEEEFGFKSNPEDYRPSHQIWIKKEEAEKLYFLFNGNKEKRIKLKDYAILDNCNIAGIFPFIKRNDEEIKELETEMGYFKFFEKPKINLIMGNNFKGDVIEIEGTRYSKEYIYQIKKMASIWFNSTPKILLRYDKEKNEIIKNNILMLIFDDKMCFILAPREKNEN